MKKGFLAMLLVICLLGVGCVSAEVTIEAIYWMSEQAAGIEACVDAYNASQNVVKVETALVPWQQYWDKLSIGIPAGVAPDVFVINALNIDQYVDNGYLLDVQDIFGDDTVPLDAFPQHVVQTHSRQEKMWGIPQSYDTVAAYINKSLFTSKGVELPTKEWTWDDLVRMSVALTDISKDVYGVAITNDGQTGPYSFIASGGGQVYDQEGTCVINSPENIATLQLLADLIFKHKSAPTLEDLVGVNASTRFMSGKLGIVFDGSWNMGLFAEALGNDLVVVPLPMIKERKTVSHCCIWAAASSTKHPAAVKDFLTYMASFDAQALTAGVVIPGRIGCEKVWAENFAAYDMSAFLDAQANGWIFPLPTAHKEVAKVYTMMNNGFADILSTGEVSNNLAALEASVNEVLK